MGRMMIYLSKQVILRMLFITTKLKKIVITAQKNGDRRREGKIIEILDHEVKTLVGTYQKNKNFGFVVPDNQRRLAVIYLYLRNTK